jgi:predicted dehydrogenase
LTRIPDLVVVGCGEHTTETLLPAITSLGRARVVGLCDADPDRARTLGRRFDVKQRGSDMHRMIDELRPDAVVLAGPPGMHTDGALHAFAAGSHVLAEKPPAGSTPDLTKMARAAEATGLTGMVAHNLRHTAAWRRLIERTPLDQLTSIVITYHASGPTGGRWGLGPLDAFLLTHAVHVFDLLNAALGTPSETNHEIHDAGNGRFSLTTQWHSLAGVVGIAVVSTCAPRLDWRVQLSTNTGVLANISSPRDLVIQGPRTTDDWSAGRRETWNARTLDAGYDAAGYGAELDHFLDCIAGSAVAAPSFTDELAVYRALDDLYDQTGKGPRPRG